MTNESVLEIRQMELGPLANFVYILSEPASKVAIVVDPAWDVPAIVGELNAKNLKLEGILLTHNHFDHINGVGELLKHKDAPVYIHHKDKDELPKDYEASMRVMDGGEKVTIGNLRLEFLHTPGHTEGSLCFRLADRLVTGDTLFIRGCGRVDLPNSDPEKMFHSLKKIATLDDGLFVLPGHNYGPVGECLLQVEKRENPYLRLASERTLADFLKIFS